MKQRLINRVNRFIKEDKKIAISVLAVLLVAVLLVGTFAWYKSQVSLNGSKFTTGTIDFIATGYDEQGSHITTILQEDKNEGDYSYVNEPLFTKTGWEAGVTETAYIAIERTGSLSMEYKISFSASGDLEYLGGFWYAMTDITDDMPSDVDEEDKLSEYIKENHPPKGESEGYSMATMDRYATVGKILNDGVSKRYYRLDYGMIASAIPTEYTNKTVWVTPTIYVTQVGALSDTGLGYTYNCSTKEDIEKARDYSLPGDSIKLLNNIRFEGDLVFNKAVNILTNNFTLEVVGNLIYDYVSSDSLTINAAGNGSVIVSSPDGSIGGNFTVSAPASNVTFVGSNNAAGDVVVAKKFTVNATRSYGEAGVTFNRVKIIDKNTSLLTTVYVEDDTRVTVLDNTTISRLEAVAKSKNIEIQNAGTIQTLVLSDMNVLSQSLSPQIYIVNMSYIVNPIQLPSWSAKYEVLQSDPLVSVGNTRIVQTITGNKMTVMGADGFTSSDIELESTDITVAQIDNNDGELIVYYQNIEENGNTVETSIEYLLEKYFNDKGLDPTVAIPQIRRLDIVSIGDKFIVNSDIEYLKSNNLQALTYLDLERASVYDTVTGIQNRLCDNAFENFGRISTLILPQNLEEIGYRGLYGIANENIITIPGSVTTFGDEWFYGNHYVAFGASTPVLNAYTAKNGMYGIKAIFVEEYYVDSYRSAYADYSEIIFPMAQKDDSGAQFVRQLVGSDEWEIVYYVGSNTTDITIGSNVRIDGNIINVTGVGEGAYRTALKNSLATIRFSGSIKTIGENAFSETSVSKVENWGSSLTTIHSSAFKDCEQLSGEITLPISLQTIYSNAFDGCSSITGINTGGAVLVEDSAFANCTSLIWVEMPCVEKLVQASSSRTSGMFYNDKKLVSVKLPVLQESNGIIFNQNTLLTEVIFGDTQYTDVAVSGFTSFYSSFGNPKLFFEMSDVSEITISNILSSKIYPAGEKMGEKYVGTFNVGEYIVSDTLNSDGTVTLITTNNNDLSGDVRIPEEWNEKPITSIYNGAFRNTSFADATLYFSDNIKDIGEYAFYQKSGIIAVGHWGTALETIGSYSFEKTGISGDLVLPSDKLISIGDSAFASCSGITSINTGSAESVGILAFSYCTSAVKAELPNVTSIGNGGTKNNEVFSYCTSLVSVSVPKLVSIQGSGLFRACNNLREIYMESAERPSLTATAFNNISSTKVIKIYVPSELLADYKSWSIGGVPRQIYPKGTKVGENYVSGYNIGEYIIQENEDGTTATLITTTRNFTDTVVLDGTLNDLKITKIGQYAFVNQTFTNVSLTLGEYVTEIDQYAFNQVKGLVRIDLNNTHTVYARAFEKCSNLAELIADELVTISGTYCFSECTALQTLTLPELQTVGNYSFNSCTSLVSVSLPKVSALGNYAFDKNSSLVSIYFENIQTLGTNSFRNCTSLKEFIINKAISAKSDVPTGSPNFTSSTDCVILVPMIYMDFYKNTSGALIWNSKPVESFDKTYTDADGNTYVLELDGSGCMIKHFIGNTVLSSIVIPNTVTVDETEYTVVGIVYGAFNSVFDTVTEITLPAGMYQFSSMCLSELTALTSIHVADGNRYYFADENGVLYSTDRGMLVKYPIGKTDTAYTVDDAVFAIGEYAFHNCTSLTSIQFGGNLTVIDSTAFAGCVLQSITFVGTTPPVLMGVDIFDTAVEGFSVTVPTGYEETYARAMNFARYASFINSGTEIPAEGSMNRLPWNTSAATVQFALPPDSTVLLPVKDEEEDPTEV